MWLMPVLVVVITSILFFYVYTRYFLERKISSVWLALSGSMFLLGVLLRKPVVYFIEKIFQYEIKGNMITNYPIPVIILLTLMALVIEELLKAIWFLPFQGLRKKVFDSPASVLELGAVSGIGFGIVEAIYIGCMARMDLESGGFIAIWGYAGERILTMFGHHILTTVFLITVHTCYTKGMGLIKSWVTGYLKAAAFHLFINVSAIWYQLKDEHRMFYIIFLVHYILAFIILYANWFNIYNMAEKQERNEEPKPAAPRKNIIHIIR